VASGSLSTWQEIESLDEQWSGLLVGNGASIAVWEKFAYASLFEEACSERVQDPLTDSDKSLFEAFRTQNFEQVLDTLGTASTVSKALGIDPSPYLDRYDSIRRALFEAVHAVHVPWLMVAEDSLLKIRKAMRLHRTVFSTNYDLLLYWARMVNPHSGSGIPDCFWSDDHRFDQLNTDVWDEGHTRILYLHGGLHLVRLPDGGTGKRVASETGNLLEQFNVSGGSGAIPLLVSEGRSEDKLRSIRSSDYLNFAYEQFAKHKGGLVVFGHSLGEGDAHLARAMRTWGRRPIAVSVRPGTAERQAATRAWFEKALPEAQLRFFDASTHPLGSEELRTPVVPEGFLVGVRKRLTGH
jgi:hypothetical protein